MTPVPVTSRGACLAQGLNGYGTSVVANTLTTAFSITAGFTSGPAAKAATVMRTATGANRTPGARFMARDDSTRALAGAGVARYPLTGPIEGPTVRVKGSAHSQRKRRDIT